ncbi:DUF1127 domain-containing protein [Phaeobacter gallaeciensis]|uniref:Small protein n=1 Tax=Phaeobacter gallaeciensis TaxID=60890 RepID=A0AAD0EBL8_9RHOB|nr:DUF1127 domain-containing protein [Phaeobacter gallaeciensis]AHD08117.1 putative small protein [Phaeobacter gallaeciensis DSM 26640]ATE91383.1 putative small protein [Phaeobacter gallaeciensis]ATE95659.1 putative small protein [Phaeobacter gallaeciensis]ATE99998.1 putative small protein [Phaeobacter gallaeciensis]ATF04431.1 putative small protein [Phaeobacter gallaeciensis]
MAHVINTTDTGFTFIARLRGVAEEIKDSWARRAEYKRTYAELDSLSNRDLADIGVRRCDIPQIAHVQAYGH